MNNKKKLIKIFRIINYAKVCGFVIVMIITIPYIYFCLTETICINDASKIINVPR